MPDADIPSRSETIEAGGDPIGDQLHARAQVRSAKVTLRFSLRALLLATTAFALVLYVGLRFRENKFEEEVKRGYKECYLAISNFNGARGRLPSPTYNGPAGKPLSSWRFRILPYWGINNLGNRYNAAWDAKINSDIAAWKPDFFCMSDAQNLETNVFAICGPGAAIELSAYNGVSINKLEELSPDVILAMEVADSKTHWMQPGDYDVTKLLAATGRLGDTVKGILPDRIHVLFADGEVWALSPDTPIDALKPFFTITAAKAASREESLSKYRVDD